LPRNKYFIITPTTKKLKMLANLPSEIIDLIMSYGDVQVTQRFETVLVQFKYHRKMLEVDSRMTPLSFGRFNVYAGITTEMFYLYILDKTYIKKNIYRDYGKFFNSNTAMVYLW